MLSDSFKQRHQHVVTGRSQHAVDVVRFDGAVTEGQQLVEQRLAVSHRTASSSGNQLNGLVFDFESFCRRNFLQPPADRFFTDGAEVESLTTGEDSVRNFVRLCRAEYKLNVRWWFFECLQQGVESFARQHVNFVDDVQLKLSSHRADIDVCSQ